MTQEFDYEKLGFKAGLEIHVQLDTKKKLFCRCPVLLRTDEPDFYVKRFFRPVMGEMGEFDKAMLREFEKGLTIIYEGYNDTTCSYEFDETPPFPPNKEAVDIAIMICLLLNCNIVDELHVCRKNYLDGSVPCGFQRTIYMGGGGYIPIDGKKISILHVYLEEEAARKDDKKSRGKIVYYKLDRLGIPLVEIVTGPDMKTPQEVVEAARRLGTLLKATGKARRGLGHVSIYLFDAIKRAIDENIPVVMSTQCLWGFVGMNVYETGRNLLNLGVIPAMNMLPEVAYVKLMWILGHTQNMDEIRKLVQTNIAGEISEGEPYNGYVVLQGGIPEVDEFIKQL